MTFGEKLQKLRTGAGLSQDALAELLDVSRQAVSRWERDETMPETEKVVRLSAYFHVTTDYLLKEEETSPGPPPDNPAPPQKAAPAGSWFQRNRRLMGVVLLIFGGWRTVLMIPAMTIILQMLPSLRPLEMLPGVDRGASRVFSPVTLLSALIPIAGLVIPLLLWLAVTAVGLWLIVGKGKRR